MSLQDTLRNDKGSPDPFISDTTGGDIGSASDKPRCCKITCLEYN